MTQNKIKQKRGKLVTATYKSYVLLCTCVHICVHLIASVCLVQHL